MGRTEPARGRVWIGTSGWLYPPWRGTFYPAGLPHRRELEHLSRQVGSVEINGSFYSLQRPESYRAWREQTPDDFLFAVKGGRFITHMKKLRDVETPLANFFASGMLALGPKLGPFLWQLPPSLPYEPDRLAAFFDLLPRTTSEAATLAQRHDHRLEGRALTEAETEMPLRHALEVRHPSFRDPAFIELLRKHDIALVVADTAGKWPYLEDVTTDFVYVRLHGDVELYTSGYTDEALDRWANRIQAWLAGHDPQSEHTIGSPAPVRPEGRDVYVYFDNDIKVRAPFDAINLTHRLSIAFPLR
ncbi:Uncharacterized conserved protein YecE, DUF72 family [Streptoalloteichus tenebrarius]|uniref:Uncharacterized conserved protein YecE, DUF72 family n=2 Tax=Actinomycetes TaxID=1760 RepID=A0ABT1HS08_STRSD|nr:DUF72 domain-containing protein [Streptoalloteichus tenebrarius]MCP2258304.1 Uncharacterized conserved protein YecE, DUF72 family [Streptoalloteichus tenebrarius]BFF03468.1 DUF72 domain-containing protein [Streptoalloteichus tenebrarius]